jgi:hypothetical protein
MRARVLVAGLAVVAAAAGSTTSAAVADEAPLRVTDACGDSSHLANDLAGVTFGYSSDSFQVTPDTCAPVPGPMGDWRVTIHLTSFSPEVQISGLMQDVGTYEYWHGMFFCAEAGCPLVDAGDGSSRPAGRRITDLGTGYGTGAEEGRPRLTYGSWRENLPDGTAVPGSISWYAEVSAGCAPCGTPFRTVDRVPDTGTATSTVLPPPRPTSLSAVPGPVLVAGAAALREDTGVLRRDSSSGPAFPRREVELVVGRGTTPPFRATVGADVPSSVVHVEASASTGFWRARYALSTPYQQLHGEAGNAVVRAYFPGDGVNAASYSAPYHAYVKAFVSLDLRDGASLPRGRSVDLRGVVRPRGAGSVEILIKPNQPGYAWWLLRQTNLVNGTYDSYYRVPWVPRTAGRYVLLTRWRHGTTDDGGVLNGQSVYRHVTVS